MSSDVVQHNYNNPYRRHSAIGLPLEHRFPDSEYEDEFIKLDTSMVRRARPEDNLEDLQVQGIHDLDLFF